MKKQQVIVAGTGVLLVILLLLFGSTVPGAKSSPTASVSNTDSATITTRRILQAGKSRLSPERQSYVNRLENSVVRGNVKDQQITSDTQLASFWKDSVENGFLLYAFYTGQAAKLENSEKSLTFAAQLFLNSLRGQENPGIKSWMAGQSRELFSIAEKLNPGNDSVKIGLGATYIFGSSGDNPANVMNGIQEILAVAKRDSLNMYAQLMLGLGGIESGQYDKAIPRLLKVVRFDPKNLEAVLSLAEAYEKTGDNVSARNWYESAKKLTSNQELVQAISERLGALK